MVNIRFISALLIGAGLFLTSCGNQEETTDTEENDSTVVTVEDNYPHSFSNPDEVYSVHLHLDFETDFEAHVIRGSVEHQIENPAGASEMIFDINGLTIEKVLLNGAEETSFEIGEVDPLLGSSLTVQIKESTRSVKIFYETDPGSVAVQWLTPQQTAGKKQPYLYTQGEAILTRSWIPCQDTPANRITYSADVQVPSGLMAVMSAENPTEKSSDGKYHFEMIYKIPTYLIALAVGDLEFASLGSRTGVYTEPSMLDKCVYEFADVEKMVETAEGLYGQYKWGRYDIIVLPPSFPFGGMENPKLTFATPTIITGDRSLVSLIAHELAHSWSGNLVTNATWDDFWLNEGFTVYIENRIMEAIYGREHSDMLLSIEYQELQHENEDILSGDYPEDTHLKLDLYGRDPDEGMTSIAYVKGALFLKTLEEATGREAFDQFLKGYFAAFQFEAMTTEIFVDYLNENLLEPNEVSFNVDEWIYGEGIPDNCVDVSSDRFNQIASKSKLVQSMESVDGLEIDETKLTTQEWMHFIRQIPNGVGAEKLAMLDVAYGFSNCGNAEIMCEWYLISIREGYDAINPHMEEFLINVGRRKFLEPIYKALAKTEEGLSLGREIYAKARPNYHSISFNTIDEILQWEG